MGPVWEESRADMTVLVKLTWSVPRQTQTHTYIAENLLSCRVAGMRDI